ncbi:MAG: hypothetical protein CL733_04340 [Chloroflexi bacterium]|nr:hypothetical protein [Chloroflexota bacterium]
MNLKKSYNPKKVALIGAGRWGYNILNTLDSIEELDLTHVVTTKQLKLEYKNQNPKLLSNWKDILNFEVDAVIIATPPATHSCILEWFIKNHTPCFIEKPLCLDYETALFLKDLAKTKNVPVFVDHTQLFQPALSEILNAVDFTSVKRINLEGMGDGPFREDLSILWDWGSHDISIMLKMLNKMPNSVSGYSTNTFVKYEFHYDNHLNVSVTNSNLSMLKKRNITVYEKSRMITFNEFPKNEFSIYEKSNFPNNNLLKHISSIVYDKDEDKPLYRALEYFGISLLNNQTDMFDLDTACNVIKLLGLADKAINLNNTVSVS